MDFRHHGGEDLTFLSPGMKFFMDIFQSVLVNMGIYLSGGDVCVSQHHLHGTQVGTVTE
jgi:hypothetical protein